MINTRILQYFSLVRYKAIKKILNNNFKLILDMEDSAQNLFSRKKTVFLKKKCREGIEYLTHQKINLKEDFLRINGIKSSYFSKDVKTIKNCQKKGLKIKAIFLPKTESYKEIKYVNKNLKIKIIPIIETIRGYNNLSKILKSDKKNLIYGVHYGHFDYCLNKKIWPFPEPYHEEFWNIVYEIIKTCNKYKKKFIQTPYPLINNDKIYWSSFNHLKNISNYGYYVTLVNINKNFYKMPSHINKFTLKKISKDQNYSYRFAKKIVDEYELNEKSKKSFSLTKKRFIAPHQYKMAKYYIKKYEKKNN